MVPVLAAYTAYSLADKLALAPGFAVGLAANMIGSGFLGAVVGGLIAGYLMRWVKNHWVSAAASMDSDFLSLPGARYVGSGQSDAVCGGTCRLDQ